EAALAHPESPVLARLGERLADVAARAQRPDGTFSGATGWTLQRLLVATADGVRAVGAAGEGGGTPEQKHRGPRARLLAEGAFERNRERVEDPYTAAAIVASGAVDGSVATRLRKKVLEGVHAEADGTRSLPVPAGVVRADGTVPSEVQSTALAVLAL